MSKRFWTASTAAMDLGMSKRHLYRWLEYLHIQPANVSRKTGHNGGTQRIYILGPLEMERLRKSVSAGPLSS